MVAPASKDEAAGSSSAACGAGDLTGDASLLGLRDGNDSAALDALAPGESVDFFDLPYAGRRWLQETAASRGLRCHFNSVGGVRHHRFGPAPQFLQTAQESHEVSKHWRHRRRISAIQA